MGEKLEAKLEAFLGIIIGAIPVSKLDVIPGIKLGVIFNVAISDAIFDTKLGVNFNIIFGDEVSMHRGTEFCSSKSVQFVK